MKTILISISIGIVIIILSFLLSKDMKGATPLYTFILSMNFGIFAGVLSYDLLWAIKNKIPALAKGNFKVSLIIAIATLIIGLSSFLGVDSIHGINSIEKHMLILLIQSTGWVGVAIGSLIKYIVAEPPNK